MNCLKRSLFFYAFKTTKTAREANYPGKLPENAIPRLGIDNDSNNLVFKFDEN